MGAHKYYFAHNSGSQLDVMHAHWKESFAYLSIGESEDFLGWEWEELDSWVVLFQLYTEGTAQSECSPARRLDLVATHCIHTKTLVNAREDTRK